MLKDNILFFTLEEKDIKDMLAGVKHTEKIYASGDIILHQGDTVENIGIVLYGSAVGKKYTCNGEEIIVQHMGENRIFGDVLSGADGFASPVTVQAVERCKVLFINYNQLLFSNHTAAHTVLQNMIKNISLKYFSQNRRMDILMIKTVRGKVMSYLEWQSREKGSNSFEIQLDRRLMADFLGVERTALSRELSRMKKEGLIDYKKNFFTILYRTQ